MLCYISRRNGGFKGENIVVGGSPPFLLKLPNVLPIWKCHDTGYSLYRISYTELRREVPVEGCTYGFIGVFVNPQEREIPGPAYRQHVIGRCIRDSTSTGACSPKAARPGQCNLVAVIVIGDHYGSGIIYRC